MFKKYKQFIIGLLLGALIFSTTPAVAKNSKIDVMFNNMKIKINGNLANIEEEPFIYKGKTYVPLRAIAELFNKEVSFDSNSNTILINDKNNNVVSNNNQINNSTNSKYKNIYYDGVLINTETNLPENAVITSTKYGIMYNGIKYYYSVDLQTENWFIVRSDEDNVYFYTLDRTKKVTIPYADMKNLDTCVYLNGGDTKFLRADLFKDIMPKHVLE